MRSFIAACVAASAPVAAFGDSCAITSPRDAATCAAAHSPIVAAERQRVEALKGRQSSAGRVLPSSPEVTVTVADRRGGSAALGGSAAAGPSQALNVYVTLAQQLEIGGQRGLRLDAADKALHAQLRRLAFVELSVAADAAASAYRVAAERERAALSVELRALSDKLGAFARARVEQAMLSPVDADLLLAEAARAGALAIQSGVRLRHAEAEFEALLGQAPPADFAVALKAFTAAPRLEETALERRGDLGALEAERDARLAHARVLERERVPNVTLQAYAQNDGFNERVLGGGLSFPIFMPFASTKRGEIDEARADAAIHEAQRDALVRRVRADVATARATLTAADATLALFPPRRASLSAITDALSAGRLPAREALFMSRSLIDYADRAIDAKLDAALARLSLARAAALPLEEVLP